MIKKIGNDLVEDGWIMAWNPRTSQYDRMMTVAEKAQRMADLAAIAAAGTLEEKRAMLAAAQAAARKRKHK